MNKNTTTTAPETYPAERFRNDIEVINRPGGESTLIVNGVDISAKVMEKWSITHHEHGERRVNVSFSVFPGDGGTLNYRDED